MHPWSGQRDAAGTPFPPQEQGLEEFAAKSPDHQTKVLSEPPHLGLRGHFSLGFP